MILFDLNIDFVEDYGKRLLNFLSTYNLLWVLDRKFNNSL